MKWKDKMDSVVKDVLGIEYTCVVTSDDSFKIFENNEVIAASTTQSCLKAHWRHDLQQTLKVIFDDRIKKSLLKY